MTRVAILGVGLMGGSLGMALRRIKENGKARYVVSGWGRSKHKLSLAKRLGAIDEGSTALKDLIPEADIIVFCTPVHTIGALAKKALPFIKDGAILTNVGSVKGKLVAEVNQVLAKRPAISFVGGHPVAGLEKIGVRYAKSNLFQGATTVLTSDRARSSAIKIVGQMWKDVGAQVLVIDSRVHDEMLALSSHLPHLLAFSLVCLVASKEKKDSRMGRLIAGSFKDMVRVAKSDPVLWTGVFEMNRPFLNLVLKKFIRQIKGFMHLKGKTLEREIRRCSLLALSQTGG